MTHQKLKAFTLLMTAGITLSACAPSSDNAGTDTEWRAEIDRLENEIGRLEFRIYQLESAAETVTEQPLKQNQESNQEQNQRQDPPAGRYDLTPVE